MVITLSAISVIFTTVALATEENVKGVVKEVILRRIVEYRFRVTTSNNHRNNINRVIGVTRESRNVMERGAITVEVRHILEGIVHS